VCPSYTMSLVQAAFESLARRLPKTELHLHIDGSLSPEFILRRASARGVSLEVSQPDQVRPMLQKRKLLQIEGGNKQEKGGNWGIFDFCNQFLQSRDELREATSDILCRLSAKQVRLCELRFCPSLHCLEGLTEKEAVEAVLEGFAEARQKIVETGSSIEGGVIVCALRSFPEAHAVEMAELAAEFLQSKPGVCGFDVAGDEGNYPLSGMMKGVLHAKKLGVPVTVHAGEWPVNEKFGDNSLNNLRLALDSHAVARIGHGIQLHRDSHLMDQCKEGGIFVECCLTSNVGWKVPSYHEHPIRQMLEHGIKVTLNCDNLLLSGTLENEADPTQEVMHFALDVGNHIGEGMTLNHLRDVLHNGADAAFIFHNWDVEEANAWRTAYKEEVDRILEDFKAEMDLLM